MKALLKFLLFFTFITGCTKEFILDVRVNPPNSGTVFPSEGTFKDGSTVTLNAAPNAEYVFSNWSGDASGGDTSVNVNIDDNKSVVANFRLRQYKLTTNVEGEGSISETIINTGKSTDYDSGTRVSLEAIPAQGYYFTGWSGALTGDNNPAELTIDSPKSVTATFEKLSYELRVQTIGEGSVSEQIIDTGKSTDYLYDTAVRLTATPEEGSDFIEWEDEGALTNDNPYDVTITEPRFIKAIFEYDLFNEVVGKWKIRKKNQSTSQQKRLSNYDVYSILFNRNRTFRLNYSSGQISGTFNVDSNSAITLNDIGSISNVQIVQGQINFNLTITSVFQFDVTGSQEQNYLPNKTSIPDQNFEQALIDSGFDDTLDGYVDDITIKSISSLDLSNRQISDFSGLEEFINLTDLNLSGNTLSTIPLVNLNLLTSLDLSNTGLTELNLSQNNGLTNLILTGNPNLSCVKVSNQIYQQIPSGWTYDSTTGFELECDCPTLSLISGNQNQIICDGEPMENITFEFGGKDVNVNVSTMPSGIQSNVASGTVTISGTPIFTNDSYTFSVFTSDGNANCNQVSQTITLNKNQESPSLVLDSGSYNQTITLGESMQPIVVTFGGSATSLNILGPDVEEISRSGNTVTINGLFTQSGTYSGTISTISNGSCTEISQNIQVVVNDPIITNTGGGTGNSIDGTTNTTTNTTIDNNSTSTSLNNSSETYSISVSAQNSSDYILIGNDRNGSINGNDPAVTLNVGDTINFDVDAPGHPFYLKTLAGTGTGNTINNASNNGTTNQIVSWTPDTTGTYYYQCSLHGGMVGRIIVQ